MFTELPIPAPKKRTEAYYEQPVITGPSLALLERRYLPDIHVKFKLFALKMIPRAALKMKMAPTSLPNPPPVVITRPVPLHILQRNFRVILYTQSNSALICILMLKSESMDATF